MGHGVLILYATIWHPVSLYQNLSIPIETPAAKQDYRF